MTTDSTKNNDTSIHEYLNVKEFAAALRLSVTSCYRLVQQRLIPFHRLRGGLRFHQKDVDAYFKACRVESVTRKDYECKKE